MTISEYSPELLRAATKFLSQSYDAVYVGRESGAGPHLFGNPFRTGRTAPQDALWWMSPQRQKEILNYGPLSKPEVLRLHREYVQARMKKDDHFARAVRSLAGKKLRCWCLWGPGNESMWFCHAQTLAIEANQL